MLHWGLARTVQCLCELSVATNIVHCSTQLSEEGGRPFLRTVCENMSKVRRSDKSSPGGTNTLGSRGMKSNAPLCIRPPSFRFYHCLLGMTPTTLALSLTRLAELKRLVPFSRPLHYGKCPFLSVSQRCSRPHLIPFDRRNGALQSGFDTTSNQTVLAASRTNADGTARLVPLRSLNDATEVF